jgi:hypothetical protein
MMATIEKTLALRAELAREIEGINPAKVGTAYHLDRQRQLESLDRMLEAMGVCARA